MRRLLICLTLALSALCATAQERKVQNKPYIDLRPLHFGVSIGLHMQDAEFVNVGPQTVLMPDGQSQQGYVLCDADMWNPGFSVGVLADLRLHQHFSLRVTPTMHFGAKHLVYRNMLELTESGRPVETTQDLKNTYLSIPVDIKFSAERFNNYRPYLIAGVSPMINLTGKDQDYVQLKRYDLMLEVGLGCDFYLPFFKLIPELKFCYGLTNALDKSHVDELTDINKRVFAQSVSSAHTKMFVLTLYFE
ncbi:MAG: PorT family protein [Prevotella sp.]|nr:PorT family protein [Prevotella sp.]